MIAARRRPWRKRLARRVSAWLAGTVGPWLFRALAATWRVRRIGAARTVDSGRALAYALWHENIPTGVGLHRGHGLTVMISSHHDGELITRVVEGLGYRTARGSTTREGTRALREMLRAAADASGLVVTPDGPRGPAHSIAPGALFLAGATGRPLVATGFAAARVWRVGSWDRMIFPKPFTRVVIAFAEDLEVPRSAVRDEALLESCRLALAARFEEAHRLAAAELARWRGGAV